MHGLRALHLTDYASAYEGAFIRQLRMLDEEIRARGGRPSAIGLTPAALERDWAERLADDGWVICELPVASPRPQRAASAAITDAIRRTQADIAHVHFGTFDLSARAAVTRLRRARGGTYRDLRLIWHYRTALQTGIDERSRVRRSKDHLKFERASRDVDLVVGVTRALADEVVARGVDPARARAIVAGCDTDTFRRSTDARRRTRERLGIADDEILLLHLGWSWHRKGGDLLAEALRTLETGDGPRIVACSIGAPEDALLGSVRALPMTDHIHEYHQASDIFISASRSEGFGNGLVEAMACERVAVAAAAEGQYETFAGVDGVLPFGVGNAAALARGVRTLLDRRSVWGTLGAANRAHVLEHHSMRRWAREMADAYAELRPDRIALSAGLGAVEVA